MEDEKQKIINLSTLKIHKLTQKQYNGIDEEHIDETAIYLTPDNSITVWQPETRYVLGDVVIGEVFNEQYFSYAILSCKIPHLSTNDVYSDIQKEYWDVAYITVDKAIHDAEGNYIPDTYATKEDVNKEIGNINTILESII